MDTKPPKKAPAAPNLKYGKKYGVKLASAFDADPADLIIAPEGHALHDPDGNTSFNEVRVCAIDKAGKYVGAVSVWSDPDLSKLIVIDGRGNVYDCREVNRRRVAEGREPIKILTTRFTGTLDEAVDLVAMKNFLRKRPTEDHTAREIARYKRLGRSWIRIAEILQLDGSEDVLRLGVEKALRARIPLAYCVPDVVEAIRKGEIPPGKAVKFGGKAIDGADALGAGEQLALLATLRTEKSVRLPALPVDGAARPRAASVASRKRVAARLVGAPGLTKEDIVIARAIAAYERLMTGDATALDYLPAIKAIIDGAREKPAAAKAKVVKDKAA